MTEFPGYAAAQREYDNRTPPEDGPNECADCDGKGEFDSGGTQPWGEAILLRCPTCKGFGLLDARGEPFDPHKAERDACDRADMQRDEQLMRDRDCGPPEDYGDF